MKFIPATQQTMEFARPIINNYLTENPIRKRNGTSIPYKILTAIDLLDWVYEGITEDECIEVAKEYADACIDDLNYSNSQEHQDDLIEQDVVNRELWG